MKNIVKAILLLSVMVSSCDMNNEMPPPVLPAAVYGQLPTRSAIIQAAEAVGAANVQVIRYNVAGETDKAPGAYSNGGYQPAWWRQDRNWFDNHYYPDDFSLTSVEVVYDETDRMHPHFSVERAIRQLFENSGFRDAVYGSHLFFLVSATTESGYRLIPLPTHAHIINEVEKLGASNVIIHRYLVYLADYWGPPTELNLYYYRTVPSDRNVNGLQGDVGIDNPRILWLSYEHPGLGSIITNNDVEGTIRKLFKNYGFESIDVRATGTLVSASFPLPSFSQITQAAEKAGATNVQVNTYIANNINVIPLNEGSKLADVPVIVELTYDGPAIAAAETNIRALFANFNTVHIGNNATAAVPLPIGRDIWLAAIGVLYIPADTNEPGVYIVNGIPLRPYYPGNAAWDSAIRIVMQGNGNNMSGYADYARNAIIRLFNERGFFNLDIVVSDR